MGIITALSVMIINQQNGENKMNDMEHFFNVVWPILLITSFIKSVTIGSAFNFYLYLKHGAKYYDWYNKTILQAKFEDK